MSRQIRFRPAIFWRCTVINIGHADSVIERGDGSRQDPTARGLIEFRQHLAHVPAGADAVERIAALMHWARRQQSDSRGVWQFPRSDDSGDVDPATLLAQQRKGTPGACRRFSYVLAGALLSAGFPARIVSLQPHLTDCSGHIMVEAWVESLHKWVLVDPCFDTMFRLAGEYASLIEFRAALLAGHTGAILFDRHGSDLKPSPRLDYFKAIANHAFYLKDECLFTDPPRSKQSVNNLKVLHYVDPFAQPYPNRAAEAIFAGELGLALRGVLLAIYPLVEFVRRCVRAQRRKSSPSYQAS